MKEFSNNPGEYYPGPEEEGFKEELNKPGRDSVVKPFVSMGELKDCFIIEMRVAGVRQDNIVIYVR